MPDFAPHTAFDAARILQSVTDSFFALDSEWRFLYLNDQAERLLLRPRAELLGKNVWEEFPAAVGTAFEREYRRAAATQTNVTFEEYYPPPLDIWFEVRAYPSPDGLAVYFHDITERRRVQNALRDSEQAHRESETRLRDTQARLGAALSAGRIATWNWDLVADRFQGDASLDRMFSVRSEEATGGQAAPSLQAISPEDRERIVQVLEDAIHQGEVYDVEYRVVSPDGTVRWLASRGKVERDAAGKAVALPGVVFDIGERKAMEGERERLADSNRLLLDSTGDGIYGIDMQGRFTFVNRSAERMLRFSREQLLGRSGHRLIHHTRPDGTPYPEEECPIYHALGSGSSIHVEEDVFWRVDGTSFPVAYTAAPILEDGAVRGSVVTFSDISERKAMDSERERLAERERNISQQLQAALQPDFPGVVPGLAITKYYKAALDEAGVGGDFWDVFSLEKGCTALVVGDLSGKGLAAAAQVATVRNMLRAFVHTQSTLAEAVTVLNGVLAEHSLLTGFATLFVGAYDSGASTLTYVNCGQEPALVRRASGAVDLLLPTGPILGTLLEAAFEEKTTELRSGDVLALFTDGLTEVGATRRAMLGVEGMIDLLASAAIPAEANTAEAVAEHIALSLMAGVDAAAQDGVMRDDMCLLIGVVE